MKTSDKKITALFLTVALASSAFLGFVPAQVAAEAGNHPVSPIEDNPEKISENEFYFIGQELVREEGIEAGEEYRVVDDSGSLVQGLVGNENGVVYIELDDGYQEGEDYILEDSSGTEIAQFSVERQTINIEETDNESVVRNAGLYTDATVKFNETSRFESPVVVTTPSGEDDSRATLNATQLDSLFPGGEVVTVDGEEQFFYETVQNGQEFELNFSGVTPGSYRFNFDVTDTTAEQSIDITVRDDRDGSVSFERNTYNEDAGDVAEIELDYSDTRQATVIIGNEEEVSYEYQFTVEDDDLDGDATVLFNTTKAGTESVPVRGGDNTTVSGTDKDMSVYSPPIAAENYELRAVVGDETDISILRLSEFEIEGTQSYIFPGSADTSTLDNASESDVVAAGDQFAIQFDAGGLYGVLSEKDASALSSDSEFADEYGVYVTGEVADPRLNNDRTELPIEEGTLVTSPDEDHFYLVYDATQFDFIDPSTNYENNLEYTLHVTEDNPYVDDTERNQSESIRVAERTVSFNAETGEDILRYRGTNSVTVSAETTIAPETTFELVLRSDDEPAFLKQTEVEVTENQTITQEFEMPDGVQPNFEFTTELSPHTDRLVSEVVSTESASVSATDQRVPQSQNVTIESVTVPDGGYVALYSGQTESSKLLGLSDYLQNGTTENVVVTESANSQISGDVTAVVLRGGPNTSFDSGEPYYTADDEVVKTGIQVERYTRTPTPTQTETPTPTITETETATETVTQTATPVEPIVPSETPPVTTPGEETPDRTQTQTPSETANTTTTPTTTEEATQNTTTDTGTSSTNAPAPGLGPVVAILAVVTLGVVAIRKRN